MDADLFSPHALVEQMRENGDPERLRRVILELSALYAEMAHSPAPFTPGVSPVPVSSARPSMVR